MHENEPLKGLEDPAVEGSAPNQDDIQYAILITLSRLYDLNLAILNHFSEEDADRVYTAHAQGQLIVDNLFTDEA